MALHELLMLEYERIQKLENLALIFKDAKNLTNPWDNVQDVVENSIRKNEGVYNKTDLYYAHIREVEEEFEFAINNPSFWSLRAANLSATSFLNSYNGRHNKIEEGVREMQHKTYDMIIQKNPTITRILSYIPILSYLVPKRYYEAA